MSDVLWWHQVLITPSIFSPAESLLFLRQTIFTQQQQLVVQRLSSHAGTTGDQPVCYAWMLQKFCCGDSSPFCSVPLIHFSLSLHTPPVPPCPSVLHLLCFSPPMGSGPGMDWSWSLVSSVVNHVYYKHHLLSHFSEGCSPPCLTQSTSWQPVRVWQLLHLKRSGVNGFDYLFIAYQDHVEF